jgi:phage tail-like protein
MPTTNDAVTGDPLVGSYFSLEVAEISGYFTECTGLGSESEVIEHKIMGPNNQTIVRKVPGRLKWGDVTLKRGITANLDFWDWRKKVEDGDVANARLAGSIYMHSQEGDIVAQWDFEAGWPSKISGPQVKSDSNEIGVEELTIVHEGIKRVS